MFLGNFGWFAFLKHPLRFALLPYYRRIGDSILNSIDQHGLSNESFKVRVKNHPGATTNICDHLKPEIRKKPDVVITHTRTNDLSSNTKSLENIQLDPVRYRFS